MKLILLALCCLGLASWLVEAYNSKHMWHMYKLMHEKNYTDPLEDQMRHALFKVNSRDIDLFNLWESDRLGWVKELNHMTDMKPNELIRSSRESCTPNLRSTNNSRSRMLVEKLLNSRQRSISYSMSKGFDWRLQRPQRVTAAKDQGACSSYAYAATGLLEGQIASQINITGNIDILSERNIFDCLEKHEQSCKCGDLDSALQLVKKQGGISSEKSYPSKFHYEANDKCQFKNQTIAAKLDDIAIVDGLSDSELRRLLVKYGPIATSMVATSNLPFYGSGVFYDELCEYSSAQPNHYVLIVGYGFTLQRQKYWIVKNSYGKKWGNQGFFKIATDNHCKLGSTVYLAINNKTIE